MCSIPDRVWTARWTSPSRMAASPPWDRGISPAEAKHTIQVRGDDRRVLPGLIDLHTHTAFGATTPGVGLDCCEPDAVGVYSGVTTLVVHRPVGVTNIGVFRDPHSTSLENARHLLRDVGSL